MINWSKYERDLKRFRTSLREKIHKRNQYKIANILARENKPDTTHAEADFEKLQQKFAPLPEYGYDPVTLWKRATSRTEHLLALNGMSVLGKRILEVGAGDGMLGVALAAFGHHPTLLDPEDWRDSRAKQVDFVLSDCCKHIPFEDNTFDLACSYNAFEHIPNPRAAINEIIRVVKPNGLIYLNFGPLYCSPWGLHAYRSLRMPYPQYLFSEKFIQQKLQELGIWDLGAKRVELQFLNNWKFNEYAKLWQEIDCTILNMQVIKDYSQAKIAEAYPASFSGRNLTYEDITSTNIVITLQKN